MQVRGTCPVCGADVALNGGGTVRKHHDHRECDGSCRTRKPNLPVCEGSGRYLRVGLRRVTA